MSWQNDATTRAKVLDGFGCETERTEQPYQTRRRLANRIHEVVGEVGEYSRRVDRDKGQDSPEAFQLCDVLHKLEEAYELMAR